MEITRRFIATAPTRFGAYLALQCALMRHYVARGGTAEEFCQRLAPSFHRRYAWLLRAGDGVSAQVAETIPCDELEARRRNPGRACVPCASPRPRPNNRAA